MLEVEVATNNAIHWRDTLSKANERAAELRTEKYRCRDLLRATRLLLEHGVFDCNEETDTQMRELLKLIEKELG